MPKTFTISELKSELIKSCNDFLDEKNVGIQDEEQIGEVIRLRAKIEIELRNY